MIMYHLYVLQLNGELICEQARLEVALTLVFHYMRNQTLNLGLPHQLPQSQRQSFDLRVLLALGQHP
ncbi:Uncharacterised protein [Streptococcus pneumoniae]|nr:Uncharacterised protein [Streptococcus pneumoniae]